MLEGIFYRSRIEQRETYGIVMGPEIYIVEFETVVIYNVNDLAPYRENVIGHSPAVSYICSVGLDRGLSPVADRVQDISVLLQKRCSHAGVPLCCAGLRPVVSRRCEARVVDTSGVRACGVIIIWVAGVVFITGPVFGGDITVVILEI